MLRSHLQRISIPSIYDYITVMCFNLLMVKAIPEGYHSITPYLVVDNASAAIDFYKRAFEAKEIYRHPSPDGKKIVNAELRIGDSVVLLSDEFPHGACLSPKSMGGTSVTLHIYAGHVLGRQIRAGKRSFWT